MPPEHQTFYLHLLNQLFELEKKLGDRAEERPVARPLRRLKELFEHDLPGAGGLRVHDPVGEKYADTRTDVDATVAGEGTGSLRIVEVLKPIVYHDFRGGRQIVQRGVVIVE